MLIGHEHVLTTERREGVNRALTAAVDQLAHRTALHNGGSPPGISSTSMIDQDGNILDFLRCDDAVDAVKAMKSP